MSDFGWGLVLLGIYVLLVILARWIYIARPNVVWTSAQAGAMIRRLSIPRRGTVTVQMTARRSPTLQCLIDGDQGS